MSVTVSVCMWTYNQEEYIEQAIDGVLMQRDCNYELIIGNDGSTDRTGEICAAYQKRYPNRIRVINHPEHKGLIMITRDCMMAATGKYIAICDSDDWWTDEYKLKKQVELLEEDSRVSMVHTNWTDYLQDSGKLIERSFVPKSDYLCESTGGGKDCVVEIMTGQYRGIRNSSVCFRKSLVDNLIKTDPRFFNPLFTANDVQFFYEFAYSGIIRYIDEPMVVYRIKSESTCITQDPVKRAEFTMGCLEIYRHYYHKYSLPADIFYGVFRGSLNSPLMNILRNRDKDMARRVREIAQSVGYKFSLGQKLILKSSTNNLLSLLLRPMVAIKLRIAPFNHYYRLL